jgi:hypothetical protein
MADLQDYIKKGSAFALNSQDATPVSALFNDTLSCCRSDCDSQMIVHVPFTTHVRLTTLALRAVAGEEPTVLKVYLDKRELAFDDVESIKPAFEIKGGNVSAKPIGLPATKFPSCESVTFFLDAEGKDTVALSQLKLFGSVVETADVTKISAVRSLATHPVRCTRCARMHARTAHACTQACTAHKLNSTKHTTLHPPPPPPPPPKLAGMRTEAPP